MAAVTHSPLHWIALAFAALLGSMPYAAHGDWTFGTDAYLRHDNNVGNAASADDIVPDTIIGAQLSMFELYPLADGYSLIVDADLAGESYNRLAGLRNVSLGGTLALKKKWGLGAYAPWIRAGVSATRSEYRDHYRNAWIYRATLSGGRRIDERWNLWAEYGFERRAAKSSDVVTPGISGDAYSQVNHHLLLNAEYALTERVYASVSALARHGDVVTTYFGYQAVVVAAIAEDPTFGDAYAYKVTGNTYGIKLGLGFAPTPHLLLGCGFARYDTHTDDGDVYLKSMPEITFDYRF